MATQYIARNTDNSAKDPQPGDVEITDAFGNVFDNFNEYGIVAENIKNTRKNRLVAFYDKDNVLLDPQPAYQNLNYVRHLSNNSEDPDQPLPDAGDWICRGVDNQVRTPEPYVKSPLFPDAPSTFSTVTVTLRVEENEGLLVTENDVSGIELEVNHLDYASTRNYDSN